MKFLSVLLIATLWGGSEILAATNATGVFIKVREVYFSKNADCSDPAIVYNENDYPDNKDKYQNLLESPTFGTGTLDVGTYNCVIWKMYDVVKFVPEEDTGTQCIKDRTYSLDVCGSSQTAKDLAGNTITCTDTTSETEGEDVFTYFSTHENANGNFSFQAPTDSTPGGIAISSGPLELADNIIATLSMDTTGKVQTAADGSVCEMDRPSFGFVTTAAN